jgi:hypothetical protein
MARGTLSVPYICTNSDSPYSDPEDGSSMYFRNMDNTAYIRMVQRPKNTISSTLYFRGKIIVDKVTEQLILYSCFSTKAAFMFPFLPLQNRTSDTVTATYQPLLIASGGSTVALV